MGMVPLEGFLCAAPSPEDTLLSQQAEAARLRQALADAWAARKPEEMNLAHHGRARWNGLRIAALASAAKAYVDAALSSAALAYISFCLKSFMADARSI